MSIAAINEQLLRAIGVGVAIIEPSGLSVTFRNKVFADWFEQDGATNALSELFPAIEQHKLRAALEAEGRYALEVSVKQKRRRLVIALTFTMAETDGRPLIVLECQNITRIRELESMIESYSAMVERNTRDLQREKERVEKLLLNLMPRSVYEEYKTFGVVTPQIYDPVSVLVLDFVGFTEMAATSDPAVMVSELNDIYTAFDRIGEQFGCERIKTIGDAYIAVAGLPDPTPDHTRAVANAAVRFVRYLERRNQSHPHQWNCRIGIATGSVVGSVVGVQKYVYDIFGPAVSLASRLQDFSAPNQITISDPVKETLVGEFSITDMRQVEPQGFEGQRVWTLSAETLRNPSTTN